MSKVKEFLIKGILEKGVTIKDILDYIIKINKDKANFKKDLKQLINLYFTEE